MFNSIKALLFRNMLLYRKLIVPCFLLIGYAFLSVRISNTPIEVFLSLYIIIFSLQFQSFFIFGLVDDRNSKFRVIYKIMGLGNFDYLISQVTSFVSLKLIAYILLFISCCLYTFYNDGVFFSGYVKLLMVLTPIFSLQAVLFGSCLSYLFTNPKISRDVSGLLNLCCILLAVNAIADDAFSFLRYLNPYYNLIKVMVEQKMGLVDPAQEAYLEIIYMLFQCAAYAILMIYLDNVVPSETDHQKSPFYFLDWFRRRNHNQIQFHQLEENLLSPLSSNIRETMSKSLAVIGIKKSFGSYEVLKNINAVFEKGKVHSLLGHNGAGKSTFINLLTGVYKPSEGKILYDNKDFRELRKNTGSTLNIGICPSFDVFFPELTVYHHLKIIGLIKNLSNLENRVNEIMEMLNLTQYKNFMIKQLSGGNKRKLTLGISIISKPNLLFLDEPTSAVDPVSRQDIWKILLELKQNKDMVMILTTHHLEEAEILSDNINVLGYGEIIVSGSVEEIKRKFGVGYNISIIGDDPSSNHNIFAEIEDGLNNKFDIKIEEITSVNMKFKVAMNKIKKIGKIIAYLKSVVPAGFTTNVDSNTLEQAYFEIDRLNQTVNTVSKDDEISNIMSRLYTDNKSSSRTKIWLVAKNKLQFIFSNVLEVLKLLMTYLFFSIGTGLLFSQLRKSQPISLEIIMQCFVVISFIEISLHSFSAYNIVYDKINDVKIMLYINKVGPTEYFAGKYLADMIVQVICYAILLISMLNTLDVELEENQFKQNFILAFFKLFMWRSSLVAFSYILSRLFDNLQNVLRYFSLLYWIIMLFYSVVYMVVKIDLILYLNETLAFFQIIKNVDTGYCFTIMVFGLQIIIFFGLNLLREYYFLRKNYLNEAQDDDRGYNDQEIVEMNTSSSHYLYTVKKEVMDTVSNKNLKLRAVKLRKQYSNGKVALDDVTFNVDQSTHFGLVGQNGAGKSTTFNIVLNRILKTSGNLTVDNLKFRKSFPLNWFEPTLFDTNNIAACFQGNALWDEMTVINNLNFYAELNNINRPALNDLVKFFDFDYYLKKKVSELSSGNQRKLCIIISLLINPNMIFYDEATCGVDLIIRIKLKHVFDYLKKKNGCNGIFTTHFLKDIDLFCNKLGVVKDGRFLCVDSLDSIKKNLGGYLVTFAKNANTNITVVFQQLSRFGKAEKAYANEIKKTESFILYDLNDIFLLVEYLVMLEEAKEVDHFSINQISIEDIYLKLLNE